MLELANFFRKPENSIRHPEPQLKGRTVECLKHSEMTWACSLAACWPVTWIRAWSSALCSETIIARSLAGNRKV